MPRGKSTRYLAAFNYCYARARFLLGFFQFDRPGYRHILRKLKPDDALIIKSIDRLHILDEPQVPSTADFDVSEFFLREFSMLDGTECWVEPLWRKKRSNLSRAENPGNTAAVNPAFR